MVGRIAVSAALVIILLVVAAVAAAGLLGFSYLQSSRSTSTSTTTTQTSTQNFTTFTQTATSSTIFPVNAAPNISSEQEWSVNITGYSYPPNFVYFDPISSQIYLSGAPSPLVTVVDANTHNVNGAFEIPGTTYAGPILLDSKAGTLLAFADTSDGEPHLFVLNESTKAVIREFPVSGGEYGVDFAAGALFKGQTCPNPNGVPMDPDLSNCGFLEKYDLTSGALLDNVSLNAPPYNIAVNPETGMVYVLTGLGFAGFSEDLLTFNGTTDLMVSEIPFNTISTPALKVDPATNTVFSLATNGSSTILTAVNGSTGRILYSSPLGSGCSVDSNRYYVDPVTNQVYASEYNNTSGNYLLVINASDGRLTNMISTLGSVYEDSTSNPASGEAYVLLGTQLVALPAQLPQTYVNPSILTFSGCFDEPV